MQRYNKILAFVIIALCGAAASWFWNLSQRIPQEDIIREFEKKSFSASELDLMDKLSYGLLNNETDRVVALVADNKFQLLCLFDHLLQRGVYYSFVNKCDSAAIVFGIANEISMVFSNNFEDNFFKRQYQFITSLQGNRIYQKLLIDLFYDYGKKCSIGGGDSLNLAKEYFQKSLKRCQKIGDKKWEVDNLVQMQFLLYDQGSHYEALKLGYEALTFARKIGYRYREGWAHFGISTTQINMNNYSQALENATQGLAIGKELNDQCAINRNLERITVANRRLGNFKGALHANDESLRYSILENNYSDQINNYINYGTIYCNLGDYAKSKDNFETALKLEQDHPDYNKSTVLENLGELCRILGDFEQALSYHLQAIEINLNAGNEYRVAGTKKYIGDVYKDQENYAEALKHYQEAIDLLDVKSEESLPLRLAADLWLCMGDVQQMSKNWDNALESYFQALVAFERVRNPEGIINSKTCIGNLYRTMKEFQQSFRYLRDAIRLGRIHQDPMLLCNAYYGLGLLNRDLEDLDFAVDSFAKAIHEIESIRRRIYYEQEQINYFARVQQLYEEMILAQYHNGNNYAAFDYSERCRARALYDRNYGIESTFANESSRIANAEAKDEYILPPGISEIQAKLDRNVQLIEYKITTDKLLIFVVDETKLSIHESQIHRHALDSLIYKFRESIGADSDREFRNRMLTKSKSMYENSALLARELYNYLIAPIAMLLNKEKVLYIIPDELLYFFPFAALVSNRDGDPRYLIEDFEIAYTPSAAILINNFKQRKQDIPFEKWHVLAVGNPGGDLVGSEEEVHLLADLFTSPKLLLRSEATKTNFLTIMKNKFHIIHLGLHAVINEKNPLYSYLVMHGDKSDIDSLEATTRNGSQLENDDNVLMAYEIFNIDFSETKLVALSACQTGCGKIFRGEGVIGLSRAFTQGGASSIISTLWKIDDRYSMKIAGAFYRNLINKNMTKANALRIAQMNLINDIKSNRKIVYPHPYLWAGFTLSGDFK